MGYFANSSEGDAYMERYCMHCRNWRDLDDGRGAGCPIIDLHMIHNYGQFKDNDKTIQTALAHFIPPKDDIFNDECRMFLPKPVAVKRKPRRLPLFEGAKP